MKFRTYKEAEFVSNLAYGLAFLFTVFISTQGLKLFTNSYSSMIDIMLIITVGVGIVSSIANIILRIKAKSLTWSVLPNALFTFTFVWLSILIFLELYQLYLERQPGG